MNPLERLSRRDFCAAAGYSIAASLLPQVGASAQPQTASASTHHDRSNDAESRDAGSQSDGSRLEARPTPPTKSIEPGTHKLDFGDDRDGFLYVPPNYKPSAAAPLIVLLHGAGQASSEWARMSLDTLFGGRGVIALVPDSRGPTWDLRLGGFGPDVAFIDRALRFTYERCNIDPKHIALAGFSDGASYSLSLGLTNGDLFSGLIAFSPGYMFPETKRGHPPVFVAHGTADQVLPIERASRFFVPLLRRQGYDVTYVEFDGPHRVVAAIASEAVEWFTTGRKPADAKPG